jgi:hypothetical protein
MPADEPQGCICHVWRVRKDKTIDVLVCDWVTSKHATESNWHLSGPSVKSHVVAALALQGSGWKKCTWESSDASRCQDGARKLSEKYR